LKRITKTGNNYNSKITNIMMILMIIMLIIIANIYFMGELINKIDDLILVYNHIKKSS